MKRSSGSMGLFTRAGVALMVAGLMAGGRGVGQVRADDKSALGPAPSFSLQSQDGATVSLSDYSGKIVVLEWVNPNCPFVQRHYKAGTMTGLAAKYKDQGVVWLAINSTAGTTSAENQAWVKRYDLSYPILSDSAGRVARKYQAKTTPDMFIVKDGQIVYRGAIDNDPRGDKGPAAVNYVAKALDEVLAGKPVSVPETRSYGCTVKYKD